MQHYYFDIHWNDETLVDEDGAQHFDAGSALYYGRSLASRIARGSDGALVRVHVRLASGRSFAIVTASPTWPVVEANERVRGIVERDRARQALSPEQHPSI